MKVKPNQISTLSKKAKQKETTNKTYLNYNGFSQKYFLTPYFENVHFLNLAIPDFLEFLPILSKFHYLQI